MLTIKNLHAQVEDTPILKGLNLEIGPGEVHAIMGPNGSGKSTLASVLAGREDYEVTQGSVDFDGTDLLDMDASERAREGLFGLPVPRGDSGRQQLEFHEGRHQRQA